MQTVIVTGASRGLGAAAARAAAALGAGVVLNARSTADLEQVAATIRSSGGQAAVVPGDVSQFEVCADIVARAIDHFGQIDALVSNAGLLEPIAAIADADPAAWQQNLAVNVLGPMMLAQAVLPHLRVTRGRVIHVSSGAAVTTMPGWSVYCAAKSALNHFNRVLAAEEEAITAIAVRPGVIDTAMQAAIRSEGQQGMTAEAHARFIRYYEEGELLPPEAPGGALAVLALHAPHAWSGEFVAWDEEKVQELVRRFGQFPG